MNQEIFKDLFIFEMANNHQGSVEHGIKIIKSMGKIARKHNIKAAIKLQYRNLDTFIHKEYRNSTENKHISRFLSTQLKPEEFRILVETIKDEGLITMCTPFDEESVNLCMDHGIEIIKVASCSANDWPLLTAIAATRKPIIISTGGKSISDIDKLYNFFTHKSSTFALLHCVALYPVPEENLQLDFIDRLRKRYPEVTIGYSGHEDPQDYTVGMVAIAKGAQILERHVGYPTDTITLNSYSMNPEQVEQWVKEMNRIKNMCILRGNQTKYISQDELESLNSLMRGVYTKRNLKKGDTISQEDVYFAMPCLDNQMTSGMFYDGMVATKDYAGDSAIYETKKIDDIATVRSVIHDAKGMLYEAGIYIGNNFEVELSHHYGMAHFRQTGAIIINLINREYCKKLIIVLPGQNHPDHLHKVKEETFQLLYGDLEVNLEGNVIDMRPGDILTVQRSAQHSFRSRNGAIFEEVSTTHIINDSFYKDEKIRRLDPIARKTIIKRW